MACQSFANQLVSGDYSQCSGVTPAWYVANDGCNNPAGCLPTLVACQPAIRRFSPYCQLIEVTRATPQVYLRVAPSIQRDGTSLTFSHSGVYLELRRKGLPDLLATYRAWRRDANGYIGFYFDDYLFAQPSGYYIGDVFIDCTYCFSVNLRLPRCEAVVTDCYVQPIMETCGQGECAVIDVAGLGAAGGLVCDDPNVNPNCATIAPFFPLDNPQAPPTAPCPTNQCCVSAAPVVGSVAG